MSPAAEAPPVPAVLESSAHQGGADAALPDAPAEQRVAVPSAADSSELSKVTLRGRCIDGLSGVPLSGCEVSLSGWQGNAQRMDAYLRDHEAVVWADPPPWTTGPDGTFSFSFIPPPPYQFAVHVTAAQRVRVGARWSTLEPGVVHDLGDVVLHPGSMVQGQVVDSAGNAQAGVEVILTQGPLMGLLGRPNRALWSPDHAPVTASRADGTFSFRELVAFGKWDVAVIGRQKVTPDSVEIPDGQAVTTLRIETRPVSEVDTIGGVVVDSSGSPLRGVRVHGEDGQWAHTDRDGSFAINRGKDDPARPIGLMF
jgi:hypothetical protein